MDDETGAVESLLVPLSPSRASDFKNCPQLFKFRVIDRLPEPADIYSARGSLVHAVLESLLRLDPAARTIGYAHGALADHWAELKALEEFAAVELDPAEELAWLDSCRQLLSNYFDIEDPCTISPEELEWWVEHEGDTAFLRGIIDRVEVMPGGEWILSDYKTGRSPSETYALGSFFGLKFYALVCWRAFGKMPAMLRLLHLKEPEVITLVPSQQMLEGLERQLNAIAKAIGRAHEKDDWRPHPSRLCDWCPHQAICPAFPVTAGSPADPGVGQELASQVT